MNHDSELLNYILQNAEMGKDTITQLIKLTEDIDFRKALETQQTEYQKIYDNADCKLKELNKDPDEINPMAKFAVYMTLNMKAIMDKSTTHLAEMMIQGSNMGIIDITKQLNKYSNCTEEVLSLANDLLKTEQNNVEQMKKFL